MGFPVGLLMGVETGSFSLSVIMMGWIGSTALAAHPGAWSYYHIGIHGLLRYSRRRYYTGKCFQRPGRLVGYTPASFAGLHLIMGVAVIFVLFILAFHKNMGYLFTPEHDVVAMVALLSWSVILYQFGDGLQILFANALRGIADVKYMAYMAFFCHFGLALPIGYICGFVFDWGAIGIWCGFPVSLTTLGILLWRRFDKLYYLCTFTKSDSSFTMQIRINKYISESGFCSRREADKYIEQGAVTLDGKRVEMGAQVSPGQVVRVFGEIISGKAESIIIVYNKPVGIVSTTDPAERDNVINAIGHPERIFPIGRLDKDSQGCYCLPMKGI